MISKWSREEHRRRREEEAAKPHPHHVIMLELMRQLRPHTYGVIYDKSPPPKGNAVEMTPP